MSQIEKLKERFAAEPPPKDFTWPELARLMKEFGYAEKPGGGSRRKFVNPETKRVVSLHEPHPRPILKTYQIRDVLSHLREAGADL